MVNCVCGTLNPATGVNCAFNAVIERVLEKPVTVTVNPLDDELLTRPRTRTGAAEATSNRREAGESGVRFKPPVCVEKEGVKAIVTATVPVCNRICGPCPAKTASVLLSGIVNVP